MKYICAIDPGNLQSAYVLVDEDLRPVGFGKQENELMWCDMVDAVAQLRPEDEVRFAIEMIASYGMPVGREVFDTCRWIGRMEERLKRYQVDLVYRSEEKLMICHSPKANDATIRMALIDRFAPDTPNKGKGTKKAPGWFYGFHADIWQAYAVAVTAHDLEELDNAG